MKKFITILALAAVSAFGQTTNAVFQLEPEFLLAIRFVESSDGRYFGNQDNGTSHGPFQISLAYLQDANEYAGTSYTLKDVIDDETIAIKVMCAYWSRYLPRDREPTCEILARIHNGGPYGYAKDSTIPYWEKVKARMEELKNANHNP